MLIASYRYHSDIYSHQLNDALKEIPMRITNSNDRTYSVHFKSLFNFEVPWQALCLATAFLFLSVMQSSAQFAPETQAPQPHQMFAVAEAGMAAKTAFAVAKSDFETMMDAQSQVQKAENDYRQMVVGMIVKGNGQPGDVPEGAFALMQTFAEAQVKYNEASAAFNRSNAAYQEAFSAFNQFTSRFASQGEVESLGGQIEGIDHGLMAVEDDILQTNDYLSELNNRLQAVEEERNTLYLTVYNWCVTHAETDLCQALNFPE